jgi:hypothetical protein
MTAPNWLVDVQYPSTGSERQSQEMSAVDPTTYGGGTVARLPLSAALWLALGITIADPTGAISLQRSYSVMPGTAAVVSVETDTTAAASSTEPVAPDREEISAVARLNRVRRTLSMNVSQLASAIRAGRPALYRWLEGDSPNESNARRLKHLYDIALLWSSVCAESLGKDLITPVGEHGSVMSLLTAVDLDYQSISNTLRVIAASRVTATNRRERNGHRRPSAIVKERGLTPDSEELQRQRILDATDL